MTISAKSNKRFIQNHASVRTFKVDLIVLAHVEKERVSKQELRARGEYMNCLPLMAHCCMIASISSGS
jgi:hypothetical protein